MLYAGRASSAGGAAGGLGVTLLEGAVSWYAGLSDGALVLLGNDANPTPDGAVSDLLLALQEQDRDLNTLHQEYLGLTEPGAGLAAFAVTVAGYYGGAPLQLATTTLEATSLVQGPAPEATAQYVARLLTQVPASELVIPPPAPLLNHLISEEGVQIDLDDEITGAICVTHAGDVRYGA